MGDKKTAVGLSNPPQSGFRLSEPVEARQQALQSPVRTLVLPKERCQAGFF